MGNLVQVVMFFFIVWLHKYWAIIYIGDNYNTYFPSSIFMSLSTHFLEKVLQNLLSRCKLGQNISHMDSLLNVSGLFSVIIL